MATFNIVTAVSRPQNLLRIHRSISETCAGLQLSLKWIVVFDAPKDAPPEFQRLIDRGAPFRIQKERWAGGPCVYGINQKNRGIDLCDKGFYYLLDDDNIIHPELLKRVGELTRQHPQKKAFAFNQQRWDKHGNLRARPETMIPMRIDNSMFVVSTELIGADRYDITKASLEDGFFFQGLFHKDPGSFLFVDEYLAYYNYLNHFPKG